MAANLSMNKTCFKEELLKQARQIRIPKFLDLLDSWLQFRGHFSHIPYPVGLPVAEMWNLRVFILMPFRSYLALILVRTVVWSLKFQEFYTLRTSMNRGYYQNDLKTYSVQLETMKTIIFSFQPVSLPRKLNCKHSLVTDFENLLLMKNDFFSSNFLHKLLDFQMP